MRKFTEIARKNNKVFIELLFWKDLKTAYEIEEGYDADQSKKTTNWSEEQEDELHRLHEEYVRDMPEEGNYLGAHSFYSNKTQLTLYYRRGGLDTQKSN